MHYGFPANIDILLQGQPGGPREQLLQVTVFSCNMFPIQLFWDAFQFKYSPKSATYKELVQNKYAWRTSTNL